MNIRDFVNKEKLKCDDIISVSLLGFIFLLFIFFRLIFFMSLVVYPISSLFLYGIYKIYKSLAKKERPLFNKIFMFILGVGSILFSSFVLIMIFSYPNVEIDYIIYFLSIPLFLIGLAAILKGSIVQVYSGFYRNMNIVIGFATLLGTFISVLIVKEYFIISLIILLGLLILNGLLRAGLYLSEYGLSVWKLNNIRLVFYMMDNLQIINPEDFENNNYMDKN